MNEIKIDLSGVSVQEFFGNQNANINKIGKYFPKIKIVARGNTLKAYGEENILEEFSTKTDMLIAHYGKYNVLNDEIIERIIFADNKKKNFEWWYGSQHFVWCRWKIIKAKTLNQKRLVESMSKNDMVFAIGPAELEKLILGCFSCKSFKRKTSEKNNFNTTSC